MAAFTLGANAAQEASDDDLWASIISRRAFLPIYDGRPDRALPLLQAAADVAARGDTGLATRYRIASLAADVYAGLGDLAACERAMGQAEGVHQLPGGSNDWLRFDGALALEERGASYVTAGRPELAVPSLERALDSWPEPAEGWPSRRRGSIVAELARAELQRRDVQRACAYGHELVTLTHRSQGMFLKMLRALSDELTSFADVPAVRDLREQIRLVA